ncbi:MAG: lipopolysaccharide biosynthesis protein [Chlorobium sp.]|nr:lipopolysaccharide biosynthesis protein [Chlorobium sp.]
MTEDIQLSVTKHTPASNLKKEAGNDVTGRNRFTSNLLYSWGGYSIVFVAGFLTPRLIDRYLGQIELGVWDFSWSFVNYLNLAMLGIGSSINRYVAKYRAAGDNDRLNKTVSTVVCLQIIIAAIVLCSAGLLGLATPMLFNNRLGEHTITAQWTILLLGASLAVNMAFDTSRGVLTGCHRWDLHNIINAGSHFLELAGMLTVLFLGGGLRLLCCSVLFVAIVSGFCRSWLARRICPELTIHRQLFRWKIAREMTRFGLKSLIFGAPSLFLVQTINLFLVQNLGPGSLAIFSRAMALVRHTETFMSKFAFILAPTAGSLQGLGNTEELRLFFLETTRYGVAFATPMILFLILDGDLILRLWMGDKYVHGPVLAILALGYFLPTAQNSIREILKGMNAHGKVGILSLCIAMGCFLVGFLLLQKFGWTLNSAATVLAISLSASLGFTPTIYACRKLHVSYSQFILHSLLPPLLCNGIFVVCLLAGRQLFPANMVAAAGMGGLVGIVLLTCLYLYFIFPQKGKEIWKSLNKIFRMSP